MSRRLAPATGSTCGATTTAELDGEKREEGKLPPTDDEGLEGKSAEEEDPPALAEEETEGGTSEGADEASSVDDSS